MLDADDILLEPTPLDDVDEDTDDRVCLLPLVAFIASLVGFFIDVDEDDAVVASEEMFESANDESSLWLVAGGGGGGVCVDGAT